MKKTALVICLLSLNRLLSAQTPAVDSGTAVSLIQCYQWAKAQNEDLKIREEDIERGKARARAAIGEALPRVAWKYDQTWNDPSGVEELAAQGFSGFVEKSQTESRFTAEQALFSGLREFSAYAGFKRETSRDTLQLERAAFELFEQTANSFYAILKFEADLENTKEALQSAEDRLKELNGFLKLGKARDSEVYTSKASAAGFRADIDQIQAAINSTRQELSYLTGHDLTTVPLGDNLPNPPMFRNLEDSLSRAKNRSDLRAQQEDVEAMRLRVRYERGSYWPSADVTGNYYTQRATFLDKIDWDVVLSVDFPLFQGGTVSGRVQDALAGYRQSVLKLAQLDRYINYEVSKTHIELASAVQATKTLEEATTAAQQSYDSLRKEYKLGLVTNLEVIRALEFLQLQKRQWHTALYRSKQLFLQLNVATENML